MSMLRGIFVRARETLARPRAVSEIDEEIRFHLELELERLDFDGYPEFVVVNEAFAAQRWPGENAIGRRLMQAAKSPDGDVWYTVSGVVAYLVSLRSREFGVRIALGATPDHLRRGLLMVVMLASLGPAQRATSVDPVEAIRAE